MQELYIDTPEQLAQLCQRLEPSPWLALDTEFIREQTYLPELCLVQLATPDLAACIDPLRIDDLEPLRALLFREKITKVFHAARQDLEIFLHLWGDIPKPVFDTQLAATLAGLGDQVGYAAAVQKVVGRELDKAQTRTDWGKRPLRQEQIRYALNDVIFLGELYLALREQLLAAGRLDWLAADLHRLCEPASYGVEPSSQWKRVKGYHALRGVRLAVLQALAAWREQQARELNRPRRWIVKDEPLLDLARLMPSDHTHMHRIRGLDKGAVKRWGGHWLALIREARAMSPQDWPRVEKGAFRATPEQDAVVDMLMAVVRVRGNETDISAGTLASRQQLLQLVQGQRQLEVLEGWRLGVVGQALLDVLDGRCWPCVHGGRPRLSCND
jgi:ribonuclease D